MLNAQFGGRLQKETLRKELEEESDLKPHGLWQMYNF